MNDNNRSARGRNKILSSILLWLFATLMFQPAWGSVILGDLAGKVTDIETGKPVVNATVTATGNGASSSATTDNTGSFSFVDLEPGTYSITIERVGYKASTLSGIPVVANSTVYQTCELEPAVYQVQGITVTGNRNQTVNPRQSMTYYGVTKQELNELLPGPASLNTTEIMQELPGVQTFQGLGGYALTMPGGPHVRGGSGLGTEYSLDGIPLNNFTLFGDPGSLGLTTGLSDFQFYPGVYPVQYGNGMDGYQNTVVPEGFGPMHGSLQFSYGFWMDQGENSPIFASNPLTGAIGNAIGTSSIRPANPDYWDLDLEGQTGKFHYFLNSIVQDGGMSGYANPVDELAISYSGIGGEVYRKVSRDNVLKMDYDLDPSDRLEMLLVDGYDLTSPEFVSPIGNGSTTTLAPVPAFNYQFYDIESLEYSHHFSAGSALTFRLWEYNSNPDYYAPTAADGYFVQNDIARDKAGRLEFKSQLTSQHKITVGAQYIYTDDIQEMSVVPPSNLAQLIGNPDFAGANNQNPSAWLNDEWTPNQKLDINVGVRWDSMIYQSPVGPFPYLTQPNGLPYATEGFSGYASDYQINNPNDVQGLFTNCTPQFGICVNESYIHPSFIQPRISMAYELSDDMNLKAGYGQFNTFADDMATSGLSTLCAAGTGAIYGIPCKAIGDVDYFTAGGEPQYGSNYDLSFEYLPNPESFIKITPYYKQVSDPLVYAYIPFAEAGGAINAKSLTSDGVELEIHTGDWHGLSGTLNYTYNNSTITGDPAYAFGLLPTYATSGPITGGAIIQPNALANAATLYNQALSAPTTADWDIKHTLNLLMDYKPNKTWEIAPNFTFMSGQPYGLGAPQLSALYANLKAACGALPNANDPFLTPATCAEDLPANGNYNPLNEMLANSLTGPSSFLANLAVTYHANNWFSTTFQIFNLFNNKQILAYNSTPFFPTYMSAFGYPAADFNPLKGEYAPNAVQPIRQYFITTTFKF